MGVLYRDRRARYALAAFWLVLLGANAWAGEVDDVEKKVREGILAFRKGMRSDDEKVRIAALDRTVVDEALVARLFGGDSRLVWPKMAEALKRLRESTWKFKREFDANGTVKEITLADVRKHDVSGRYRQVLKMIPADVPVYTAVMKCDKGTGGSSSYLLVDGRMRWVPNLEGIAGRIVELKDESGEFQKKPASFENLSRKFLAAMRSGKAEDAVDCWVSIEAHLKWMEEASATGLDNSEAERKRAREEYQRREKTLRKWFAGLLAALEKEGMGPADLVYAGSEGTILKKGSLELAANVVMTFGHKDGRKLKLRVDTAGRVKGGWRFADVPSDARITKGGEDTPLKINP